MELEEYESIIALWEEGMTPEYIASKLNLPLDKVFIVLKVLSYEKIRKSKEYKYREYQGYKYREYRRRRELLC